MALPFIKQHGSRFYCFFLFHFVVLLHVEFNARISVAICVNDRHRNCINTDIHTPNEKEQTKQNKLENTEPKCVCTKFIE